MAGVGVKAIGNDLRPCPSLAAIFENRSPYARPASGKFPNGAISELSLNSGSFAAAPEWASRSAIVHSGFPDHFLRVLVAPEPHDSRCIGSYMGGQSGHLDCHHVPSNSAPGHLRHSVSVSTLWIQHPRV